MRMLIPVPLRPTEIFMQNGQKGTRSHAGTCNQPQNPHTPGPMRAVAASKIRQPPAFQAIPPKFQAKGTQYVDSGYIHVYDRDPFTGSIPMMNVIRSPNTIRASLIGFGLLLLPGCMGLSPEDKTKLVDASIEEGKTEWCLDLAILEPLCITKNKEKP